MPNANYRKGRAFEYDVKDRMQKDGYEVMRTSGSHGPFDLIGISHFTGHILLVQCKVTEDPQSANRMMEAFRKAPPFLASVLPPKVAQRLVVKVTRKGQYEVTV